MTVLNLDRRSFLATTGTIGAAGFFGLPLFAGEAQAQAKKLMDDQLAQLGKREENLRKELTELQSNRGELAAAVEEGARSRYERLARSKGENVVVGVNHGVCGGCHMKLQPQLLVACRGETEIVTCSNCGRILYYTREMNLAAVE